jgi:hypothetical protein
LASSSLLSVSLILRFQRGSITYSSLIPAAENAALFELANAINSLQREVFESANKRLTHRVSAS